MTNKTNICPKCSSPIAADAPGGLCPKCLMNGVKTTAASEPPTKQIPDIEQLRPVFSQYEFIELIGCGGMGFVFKVRHRQLEREIALKLLPEELGTDPQFAERFIREARVLARLNHPNIVTVYDFGFAGGYYFLAMEYVEGLNLRQAMLLGKFSPNEALALVPKVCEALQYAHEEGVLHRDIKPENLLLDTRGRIKIADFGIAKILGEEKGAATLTATGASLGTPHYMAPEQFENPAGVDHRADIYSLGVVFYEMLTGELPLGRFSAPSARAELDERIDAIVLRALAKERDLRQRDARELQNQVETVAAISQPSASRSQRGGLSALGRRTVAIASATLAIALLSFLYLQSKLKNNPGKTPDGMIQPNASATKAETERTAREDAAIEMMRRRFEEAQARHAKGEISDRDLAIANRDLRVTEARRDTLAMAKATYEFLQWDYREQIKLDPKAYQTLYRLEQQMNQAQHAMDVIQAGTNRLKRAFADLKFAERTWGAGQRWKEIRIETNGTVTSFISPEELKKIHDNHFYAELEYNRVKQKEEERK